MWRRLLNQCSYGWKIAKFSCKFPSVRTENNTNLLLLRLGLVGFSRVSKVSKIRAEVRVSVMIRASLVSVIGWG